MELAQRCAEQRVLEKRQDLVADVLVQRHPTGSRAVASQHARPEHGICLTCCERFDEFGEALGSVLAVSMHERNEVEALLHGVMEPDFLVSTIALIDGI